MTRRARRAVWVGGAVVVLGLSAVSIRFVPFFRVRQVELVGVRYLSPSDVVRALALAPHQSVFGRVGPARRRLERLPGVARATIERRLPAAWRVSVTERAPIAFVSGPDGMVALDCAGHPLPYDPSRGGIDVPLAARADPVVIRALCTVWATDTLLYHDVDLVARGRGEAITLDLSTQRVVLPTEPTTAQIRAVSAVRRHLAATGLPVREVDARFTGWIVVRRGRS